MYSTIGVRLTSRIIRGVNSLRDFKIFGMDDKTFLEQLRIAKAKLETADWFDPYICNQVEEHLSDAFSNRLFECLSIPEIKVDRNKFWINPEGGRQPFWAVNAARYCGELDELLKTKFRFLDSCIEYYEKIVKTEPDETND